MVVVRSNKFSRFTIPQLTAFAATRHRITIPSKFKRKQDRCEYVAAVTLQRWFRGSIRAENTTDFISWESISGIPRSQLYQFLEFPNHKRYLFLPKSLYAYFLQTGKFQNPFTRTEFDEADLFCLWRMLRRGGGKADDATGDNPPPYRKLHLEYRAIQQELAQQSQLEQTLNLLSQEAMAGLAVVWENPAPLPMSYHLFYICETVVPVFISRAEEMRLLSPQYVRSMVRRVLGTLQSQIAQLRMSARIIDMNRRTLCVTCHDLLQTYMHAAFRE